MKLKELKELLKDVHDETELNFFVIPNDGSEDESDENDIPLINLDVIYSGGLDSDEPYLDLGLQFES